jgi:hypothetical protein
VLALLAFACLPGAAQADSAGAQYEVGIRGPGNKPPAHKNEQIAEKSESPGNTGGATAAPTGGGGGGAGSGETGGGFNEAPSSGSGPSGHHQEPGTGNGGGKGQGSPEKGATPKGNASLQPTAPTSSSSSGGSSPLVPILIVIGALALISIGAFVIRQRRQRGGGSPSSLSTKAG